VASSCERNDEPSGLGATELVIRNAHRILVGGTERKTSLARPRRR
jgi:hypothetical protein